MGLKKKAAEATADDSNKVEETAAPEEKVETSSTEETTTTEVATQESAGVPAEASLKPSAFCKSPLILEAVAGATYGTFPSVTANSGTHMCGEEDLGKVLKFQAILAKEIKKVIPGSQDDESDQFFKVSEDGETTKEGQPLEEALQDAKDAGYDKAAIKIYIDVICNVVECDNKNFVGETITLQLAPSSQYTWRPLEGKCKMKAALGTLKAPPFAGDPDLGNVIVITSTATPTKYHGNSFTKFEFSL